MTNSRLFGCYRIHSDCHILSGRVSCDPKITVNIIFVRFNIAIIKGQPGIHPKLIACCLDHFLVGIQNSDQFNTFVFETDILSIRPHLADLSTGECVYHCFGRCPRCRLCYGVQIIVDINGQSLCNCSSIISDKCLFGLVGLIDNLQNCKFYTCCLYLIPVDVPVPFCYVNTFHHGLFLLLSVKIKQISEQFIHACGCQPRDHSTQHNLCIDTRLQVDNDCNDCSHAHGCQRNELIGEIVKSSFKDIACQQTDSQNNRVYELQ
nr:MAG TPA: hypothetical protein [Caudoviricetes sp.]